MIIETKKPPNFGGFYDFLNNNGAFEPIYAKANAEAMFKNMFSRAFAVSPFSKRDTVSRLNELNVVNPPKKPVISRTLRTAASFGRRDEIMPIIRPPHAFTDSVANGKYCQRLIRHETAYLDMLPKKPPAPAAIIH